MTLRGWWSVACAAGLLLSAPAARAQEGGTVTLGVFLPGVPLGSADARSRLANDLASALGRSLGVKIQARSYSNQADFERELPEIWFALVESSVAVTSRPALRPLAVSVSGGGTSTQFALFATKDADSKAMAELEGKRLAHARIGRATGGIIDWLLFEGEIATAQLKRVPVPDVLSGISLLKLDKADYLLGYASSYDELRRQLPELKLVFRSGRVPNLTFALGPAAGASDLGPKALVAVSSFTAAAADISGFRAASGGDFDSLRRSLGARPKRTPLFGEPSLPWRGGKVTLPPASPPQPAVESYLASPPVVAPLPPR